MAQDEYQKSLMDLYIRLLPAINTKVSELKRIHFYYKNIDIWNYCIDNIWRNKSNLRIYEMVNDILNIDELNLKKYITSRYGDNNER